MSAFPAAVMSLAASLPPSFSLAAASAARKGGAGRVFVVGGSTAYTGAPFFAGMASLRAGADLAWVLCAPGASIPLKTLAPDLIVLPNLGENLKEDSVTSAIERATSFVVGPGLSREPSAWAGARAVIEAARVSRRPVVIDGDALYFCSLDLASVRGHPTALLTPNAGELQRLYNSAGVTSVADLAAVLGVAVLSKGAQDVFVHTSREAVVCDAPGAPRRCGGQGDILAGTIGAWLSWAYAAPVAAAPLREDYIEAAVLAACCVTRDAARRAFSSQKRSMVSNDILAKISDASEGLFPVGSARE